MREYSILTRSVKSEVNSLPKSRHPKRVYYTFYKFKEVRNYRTPKLSGCQEPNADGQFTRPFGTGAYNLQSISAL